MAKRKTTPTTKKPIESYQHSDKERLNNPPVGMVNPNTDKDLGQTKKQYQYDPHLDPQLQWTGKAEHTSFEVPTVSLHVHERIDPKTILEAVKKQSKEDEYKQASLFEQEKKPLREAVEFYKHKEGWTNRMISGDSLLVMNSLLEKEGMAGKVQMVYIDPPYGIKYGSNFQPFTNKRDVKDGKDEDLTAEPEMIKAFRDTWELGIHSYLTYMRDRLLLAKDLLHESGSCFVQISDENVHHVRELMDEIFGVEQFASEIIFQTTSGFETGTLSRIGDRILWYAKNPKQVNYNKLFASQELLPGIKGYNWLLLEDGSQRGMTAKEKKDKTLIPKGAKVYKAGNIKSQGSSNTEQMFNHQDKTYHPGNNHHWKTHITGMKTLAEKNRIHTARNSIQYRRFIDDFAYMQISNVWLDTGTGSFLDEKLYVVQTSGKVLERCIQMTTDPGDLVLDITCGSGTTAAVAEQWGRRWITCDTSRVAVALAKQRLMTAQFDYYKLMFPNQGISAGFEYKTVPHITLKSIANNEPPATEILYDQPLTDSKKTRVTGPFTIEAVPAPSGGPFTETGTAAQGVKGIGSKTEAPKAADHSLGRSGETLRQQEWRDELEKTGIRGKNGQMLKLVNVQTLGGTQYINATADLLANDAGADKVKEPKTKYGAKKVFIVFGPEHAPLEQRQVELAIDEARMMKPELLLFCAFQFDEEAAKDIDETPESLVGFKLLKVQMNMDLQTDDLKKKRSSNQSFWLIGQPDIEVIKIKVGEDQGKVKVKVSGFDYYNTKTGNIEGGDAKKIAMWMLDTDYDDRSLFPRQVFFPMSGAKDGWSRLAKNLKAELDEELIEAYRGTESLPFKPGHKIAVKIIDDRGIESLRVIKV